MTDAKRSVMNHSRATEHDNANEQTLDGAIEMSFPASDPVSSSNITRMETVPELTPAAGDHQNSSNKQVCESTDENSESQVEAKETDLTKMKVAILVTDGFEQAELLEPKKALEDAGVEVEVISDKAESVQGFEHTTRGVCVDVDKTFDNAHSADYAAVLLPGGVVNGDAMRMLPQAQEFIRQANRANKPIASICHGGWLLISAGVAHGRTVTSWPSMQDDFENAGSHWLNKEVVSDENFISSRKPSDIPAFNRAFISLLNKQHVSVA